MAAVSGDGVATMLEATLGAPRHYGPTDEEAAELARETGERDARLAAIAAAANVGGGPIPPTSLPC